MAGRMVREGGRAGPGGCCRGRRAREADRAGLPPSPGHRRRAGDHDVQHAVHLARFAARPAPAPRGHRGSAARADSRYGKGPLLRDRTGGPRAVLLNGPRWFLLSGPERSSGPTPCGDRPGPVPRPTFRSRWPAFRPQRSRFRPAPLTPLRAGVPGMRPRALVVQQFTAGQVGIQFAPFRKPAGTAGQPYRRAWGHEGSGKEG